MSANGHGNGPIPNGALPGGGGNDGGGGGGGGQQPPQLGVGGATGPPLADLLVQLEDYAPTIPDSVTRHFLATAGVDTDDPRIVRLVSLATQKFVADLANDALQHCKMRGAASAATGGGGGGQGGGLQGAAAKKGVSGDRRHVLTVEDLSLALADQGITLKKPPYYV